MRIRQGIILSSVLIIVFISITASLSYYSSIIFDELQATDANNKVLLELADELRQSSAELTSNVRSYVATQDIKFKENYNTIVRIRSGEEPRPSSRLTAPSQSIALLDLLRQYGISDLEFALLEEANNLSNSLISLEVEAMNAIEGKTKDGETSPNQALALQLVFGQKYQEEAKKIQVPIERFFQQLTQRTGELSQNVEEKFDLSVFVAIAFSLLTLFTACLVFLTIFRQIVIPITKTTLTASYIAEGNLTLTPEQDSQFTAYMQRNNEIADLAQALKTMITSLAHMVEESEEKSKTALEATEKAQKATEEAEEAAKQASLARQEGLQDAAHRIEGIVCTIFSASEQLSAQITISTQGAEEQSSRMGATSAAMQEMNSTVLDIARNSGDSAEIAENTKHKALEGVSITQKCQETMLEVKNESSNVRVTMSELADHAQSISAIMGVISDIADQTNLLALNAAIEAARAGEAGRGFAVVADEVRKLAEKTIASTSDVAKAINAIQQSTEVNVQQVDSMVKRIEEVTELTINSGEALTGILSMAEGSADGIRAIATASEEQSATSDEVSQSIHSVASIAEETKNAMLEATDAVNSLMEQSQQLSELVNSLKS